MLIDTRALREDSTIEGDVVIAGGGMAGITLAKQLGDAGLDVVILESGGATPDARVQALYEGSTSLAAPGNDARDLAGYLRDSRVRCFGGSGNVWGGKCAPLDPIDFEKRGWIAHSGWPVTRAQMQPYYDRACRTLGLEAFGTSPESVLGTPDPVLGKGSTAFTLRPRLYSATTGSTGGEAYETFKRAAAEHPRVRVYLHANVTGIRTTGDGASLERLVVRELSGRTHTARARNYILAMGGIENVRLMMVSNSTHRAGIGNQSGWLGRAFQVHTVIFRRAQTSLSIHRPDERLALFDNTNRAQPHAVIGTSDAAQRKHQAVNFTATLTGPPKDSPPDLAIVTLAQRLSRADACARRGVYFMIEHTPNRSSRLALVPEDLDELNMPRLRLDIRYNEQELESLDRSIGLFASELGRLNAGRVQWTARRDELISLMAGPSRHHMGATRMSTSPGEGVVNEDSRVHGMSNLYVAGCSVFPTSGIANPTLTLLALAHRLGDRLVRAMSA